MTSHIKYALRSIMLATLFFCSLVPWVRADNILSGEVKINLSVTKSTCDISPDDQEIHVHFGTASKQSLSAGEEPERDFTLHLINCDSSVTKSINLKFTGDEASKLPGLLELDSSSAASGFAVGLRDEHGNNIAVNHQLKYSSVQDGDNNLNFKAYLEAFPSSKEGGDIVTGNFSAQSVLEVEYD